MNSRSELVKEVLNNEEVTSLVKENNISIDEVNLNLNTLLAYTLKCKTCKECDGLSLCNQAVRGYGPVISYSGVKFDLGYLPCKYLEEQMKSEELNKNLKLMSCSFDNLNLEDVYVNNARSNVLRKIVECLEKYEKGEKVKGLYIHGKYGCGKTYLLAYLANKFAKANHKVIFAYYPDLARNFRSSITTGNLEDLIETLKEIEILVLDDFGGETMTNYLRDEVLGSILQDRMINNKLTFMSSNLDEKLLMNHLKESNNSIDEVRASRIYERIRVLMDFVELTDQNYRN